MCWLCDKGVKSAACTVNDAQTNVNFLKKDVFARFEVPRVLINDGGKYLSNKYL